MKNKILSILALVILVFSSLGVVGLDQSKESIINICEQSDILTFSNLNIQTQDDYTTVGFEQASTYTNTPGEPMLPVCVKVYKFPLGTKIFDVELSFSDTKIEVLSSKIKPAQQPQPLLSLESTVSEKTIEDPVVYSSSQVYPDKTYDYNIGVGLDGTDHVIILTVRIYPVRYAPSENTIYYSQGASVKVSYALGDSSLPTEADYDMVIIAPRKFVLPLNALKNHKNKMGIQTKIVTAESIYFNYKGRDKQEDIKLFIKYAIEKWNITYVLLVGAREGLGVQWTLPARYSNLEDRGGWNDSYVTDLYYADVYKYNSTSQQNEFDDWDSNGNGVFAEWKWTWNPYGYWTWPVTSYDSMDLYPDVYIGRLACKDNSEVRTVVRKINNYENNVYNTSWFKTMIVGGGDTVPYGDGIPEGEYENEYAAVRMEAIGFNVTRLWASTGALVTSKDVITNVSKGAGFLYLSGHGSPIVWSTHPFENDSVWIDGLWNDEMNNLKNRGKLPITVVGGCHNSQFDVAPINMIKGILQLGGKYFTWIDDQNVFGKLAFLPRCWSWNLVRQRFGGAIAAIGNTGLGWGTGGESCIENEDGFITSHFFETYVNLLNTTQNVTLGMAHSQNLNLYIEIFNPNDDELDRKTVEEWVLLGDPSLMIGGYPD